MKEHHFLCCLGIVAIALCYCLYMATVHGDGVVFASVVGAITAIIGYNFGLKRSPIGKK